MVAAFHPIFFPTSRHDTSIPHAVQQQRHHQLTETRTARLRFKPENFRRPQKFSLAFPPLNQQIAFPFASISLFNPRPTKPTFLSPAESQEARTPRPHQPAGHLLRGSETLIGNRLPLHPMAEQDGAAEQSPLDSVPVRFAAFCLGWFGLSKSQVPLEGEACEVRLGSRLWGLRVYQLRVWFFSGDSLAV